MTGFSRRSDLLSELSSKIRSAFEAGDYQLGAQLLEENIIESWYGLMPDELNNFLLKVVKNPKTSSRMLQALVNMLNIESPILDIDMSDRMSAQEKQYYKPLLDLGTTFKMRFRGDSVAALNFINKSERLRAPTSIFFDESRGRNATLTLQYGITAMLAGDLDAANEFFLQSQMQRAPDTLPFLTRDAYAKHALIHAAYGSSSEAEISLDHAATFERTSSWAEKIIDATVNIAKVLLNRDNKNKHKIDIKEIPLRDVGEMWPYYVLAVHRSSERSQDRAGVLKTLNMLEQLSLPRKQGCGLGGSAFELVRATTYLTTGDIKGGRAEIAKADQNFVGTKVTILFAESLSGQYTRVIDIAQELLPRVQGLRQLNIMRFSLLIEALLKLENYVAAETEIKAVLTLPGKLADYEVAYFSSFVRKYAESKFADWPKGSSSSSFIETLSVANSSLTEREIDTLKLLATNLTRDEIGAKLFVSVNTIKKHLSSIYEKLEVANRKEAVAEAVRRGLL